MATSRKILLWAALLGVNCTLWLAGYNLGRTGHTRLLHGSKKATVLVLDQVRKARHVQGRLLGDRSAS